MALEEAPSFWWGKANWQAWALAPLAYIYGKGAAQRMAQAPTGSVDVPVICVGNFIAGGAGKTPTAIHLAKFAIMAGLRPGFLSRGYGGGVSITTLVNPETHNAQDVGDEPLLLAEIGTTVVSANRLAGARMLVQQGCNLVIMDDGFQNPQLLKDYSLVVVDSERGIGNGFAMPAGPLRLPLAPQLLKADAILVIGDAAGSDKVIRMTARAAKPVFHAKLRTINRPIWQDRQVIAFAGIANPQKFFDSLVEAGAEVIEAFPFGDHHTYSEEEAQDLINKAMLRNMTLVTTSKDKARMQSTQKHLMRLAAASEVLNVGLVFDEPTALQRIIREALTNAKKRIAGQRRPI